jgi:CubicO group peptidase (beta-lactamase class C family)
MDELDDLVERTAAETGFSGAVRIDRHDGTVVERAFGSSERRHGILNTAETQFALASGAKGFTALVVESLIEDGVLRHETPVRSLLGGDLPLIDPEVSVEHLLSHRSGIGDYLDESALDDIGSYTLPVPVHRLVRTEDYLAVLDGHPQAFAPGSEFAYCNGGFVVLALVAERASGTSFHDLVRTRVCEPAGMSDTGFFRSDDLPARAAVGYVTVAGAERANVHHLPLLGSGDGGIYSTVADVRRLWQALFAGRIVPSGRLDDMLRARSERPDGSARYGLGFWLLAAPHRAGSATTRDDAARDVPVLEGYDAGVSFRSSHDPVGGTTCTVVSNTSEGAWPMWRAVAGHD